jgi:hypothetical protein
VDPPDSINTQGKAQEQEDLMKRRLQAYSLLMASLVMVSPFLMACSDDDDTTGPSGSSVIGLTLEGLAPLEGILSYQVWAIGRNGDQLTGYPLAVFDVDEAGRVVTPVSGQLITSGFEAPLDAGDIYAVGVSIEASYNPVSISSSTLVMGGEVVGGVAQMNTDFWFGVGLDLSQIQGRYVLITPTDGNADDELSGLWFLDPFQGPSAPGLDMPSLLDGWDYEGWVEIEGQPVSTGKFFQPDVGDGWIRYGGPYASPDVPGEDFLRNAPSGLTFPTDLSGGKVYVTLEPWQQWDNDLDEPFFIRILEGDIPAEATPNTVYAMTSLVDQLPRGTATVQ